MNRMNLDQLVTFFENNEMPSSANYFKGCANDSVTIEGLIEADFVKRHVMIGSETERSTRLWREIQANVTTYVGCYMDKEKCETCNYENGHHSLCPENFSNSDSYQYQECQ
jgi:hypothetical protein